ncbi:hypothetical protein [Pedobacter miscanthi]|uniref:hypothetical protein n=1 Tax=Pedobacter miscanthi TaxID=2259170 RepID=UPI001314E66A|nr:hypothetical protein [Pedobacter miscanthi]
MKIWYLLLIGFSFNYFSLQNNLLTSFKLTRNGCTAITEILFLTSNPFAHAY